MDANAGNQLTTARPGFRPDAIERMTGCRQCALMLLVAAALVTISGCMSSGPAEQASEDTLPWNTPASWEGQVMGVPY